MPNNDLYGDPGRVLKRVLAAVAESGAESLTGTAIPAMYGFDAIYYRELDDGRCIVVYRLVMGTVRVTTSEIGSLFLDDAWCYSHASAGLMAASAWDGNGDPPEGWFRHIRTARRRPEGDPEREYVAR
jgi:hypothetical protein